MKSLPRCWRANARCPQTGSHASAARASVGRRREHATDLASPPRLVLIADLVEDRASLWLVFKDAESATAYWLLFVSAG